MRPRVESSPGFFDRVGLGRRGCVTCDLIRGTLVFGQLLFHPGELVLEFLYFLACLGTWPGGLARLTCSPFALAFTLLASLGMWRTDSTSESWG